MTKSGRGSHTSHPQFTSGGGKRAATGKHVADRVKTSGTTVKAQTGMGGKKPAAPVKAQTAGSKSTSVKPFMKGK